ncbi:N-acetylmuramoyl-L-alanine amidase [Sphingomonas sp.]|uniref:N-acetylmuramoyl-L-alanine amidase family protein n=1 Tax=Sphingomonas sp. TaxID=28214 RepID=UPI00286A838B|nr:N-acetylmuramoyl-L-alanine amidase [Sphingomonas sp.]
MTVITAKMKRAGLLAGIAVAVVTSLALLGGVVRPGGHDLGKALVGEARQTALTLDLPQAVADVPVSQARLPGRPIVLIDPGHGGHDPGAIAVSGKVQEKALTLALATELRDLLVARGRVRVAMTRRDDRYLTLDQRPDLARRLGAALFVSVHMDHAPNPLARGVTIYSLSDVASDAEAARFAAVENRAGGGLTSEPDGSVRALLSDLAVRGQMEDSAAFAQRLVRRASGPVLLRPRPHQFAAFHVLRRADTPAVLVEAGYISNVDDEAALVTAKGRAPLVLALAQAIEADLAVRR